MVKSIELHPPPVSGDDDGGGGGGDTAGKVVQRSSHPLEDGDTDDGVID